MKEKLSFFILDLKINNVFLLGKKSYSDLNNYYEEYTVQYVSQSPGAFLVISNMILLTGAEDYIFTFLEKEFIHKKRIIQKEGVEKKELCYSQYYD